MKLFSGTFLILFLFSFVSCETTFDPLEENDDLVFSMYGVFDVHADSQWVRVMPIGTSLFPTDPDIDPVEVQLTDDETGETWMLQDSLFRFGNNSYVYNYLFPDSVKPDQSYTLTATAEDGRQSTVIIDTPSELQTPEVSHSDRSESARVSGFTLDSVVVIDAKYLVQPILEEGGCAPEIEISFPLIESSVHRPNGDYFAVNEHRGSIGGELGTPNFVVNKRSVLVAVSKSDWPNTSVLEELEVAIPGAVSNVERGTGVVAGIASKEVVITPRRPPC